MDPIACYNRFLDALRDNDTIEAVDAAIDLSAWLNRGSLSPFPLPGCASTAAWWTIFECLTILDPDDHISDRRARALECEAQRFNPLAPTAD